MMNEIELRQLLLLFKNYLKKQKCTEYYILSAHTNSRFDVLFKSGETSIVGEYKYRSNNIEDYFNRMMERKKYDALTLAAKLVGGKAMYIVESDNMILIYD